MAAGCQLGMKKEGRRFKNEQERSLKFIMGLKSFPTVVRRFSYLQYLIKHGAASYES